MTPLRALAKLIALFRFRDPTEEENPEEAIALWHMSGWGG